MSIEQDMAKWTSEEVWAIHQFLEQLQNELQQNHGQDIANHKRRDALIDDYAKILEGMSEEELMAEGVWLESKTPDPF